MGTTNFDSLELSGDLTVTGNTTGTPDFSGAVSVTSPSASALAVGRLGATTPAFVVDASTASQAVGLKVTGAAASGVVAAAVAGTGTNCALTIDAKGSGTVTINGTATGIVVLPAGTTIGGSAVAALGVITSASATALAVGLAGATNPAFVVDSSTGSQAAGLKVTGAVAAGTVAAAVVSSGADASLTVNAKGTGTIGIGTVSTGVVTITPNLFNRGRLLRAQAAPAAKTVTAGISAAELIAGLITTTGVTGPSIHQLPTGTEIDGVLPGIATGDSFDFTIINTGVGAADDATVTVNTDVTIIGNPTVGALTDATIISGSGTFRARRSAANTYVVYRIS
jgi:hypothetical protein